MGLAGSWEWRRGDKSLFNFSAMVIACFCSKTSLTGSVLAAD